MARNNFFSTVILAPISFFYGIGVSFRNWMFNRGLLKSESFDIPVIVVGNIAVGGTGKTPHTEYIVDYLRHSHKVGVLSRGYHRNTKGFILASPKTTVEHIGDEPLQIYRKFGNDVTVAVCENRVKGIKQMREIVPDMDMVVLDDAFQHRYVRPALSIVLTDYSRPIYEDSLLPYGRLRESISSLNRADIVVVTKCPHDVRPMDLRIVRANLNLYPYQKLFFSTFDYGDPVPLFPRNAVNLPDMTALVESDNILSLTGIENPRPFLRYLRRYRAKVKVKRFPDHHFFTETDLIAVAKRFEALKAKRKFIFTTEKDAMRLKDNPVFPEKLKPYIFYVPIKVRFIESSDSDDFNLTIMQMIKQQQQYN